MSRTPAATKVMVARRVQEARSAGLPVNELVTALAKDHGVSRASIFSWASGDHLGRRERIPLSRDELTLIAKYHGNVRAAHEELSRNGYDLSYSQFCRRLDNTDTDFRAAVTEGMTAMIQAGLYNVQEGCYDRGDVFGYDHTEIPVEVMNPGDKKRKKIWVTVSLDWSTGFIFRPTFTEGEKIKGDPNTESVVAQLTSVMLGQDFDGHRVGGIPDMWTMDNAAAHFAQPLQNGFKALDTISHAIRPASPWENGPTEGAINSVERSCWSRLQGYTHHLPTRYGKSAWADEDLMTPQELIAYTVTAIEEMNRKLKVRRLGGKTRLEAWLASPNMPRFAKTEQVRKHFLYSPRGSYKITKNGVNFRGRDYVADEFHGKWGRQVQVRYLLNDPSFIDVYYDGEVLATAVPQLGRPIEDRSKTAAIRRSRVKRAEHIFKRSKERVVEDADREMADAILADPDGDHDDWNVDEALDHLFDLGDQAFGPLNLNGDDKRKGDDHDSDR